MSEQFGQAIDRLENLNAALQLPLRAEMHITQLKISLPEVIEELKAAYVHQFGEDPWKL